MIRFTASVFMLAFAIALSGCANLDSWITKQRAKLAEDISPAPVAPADPSAPTPVEPVIPGPEPVESADALALSDVHNMIVLNSPGVSAVGLTMASITAKLTGASTNGKTLYTSFDKYSFPASDGTDAICYFFYERDGKVVGGKFDWWRPGGQGTKGLENVHNGYGGHVMPAKGTRAWTMISSKDGKQRSNTVEVKWK